MRTRARTLLLLLAALVSWLGASSIFGQGTVTFINDANSMVRSGCNGPPTASAMLGLWAAPNGTAESALSLVAVTTIIPGAPGFFNGGLVTIPGVAGGANATFQIRAWIGALTYAQALTTPGAFTAKGPMWTQRIGGPVPNPPAAITLGLGGGLNSPIFFPECPEPSAWAFALVAGGIFFAVRRLRRSGSLSQLSEPSDCPARN